MTNIDEPKPPVPGEGEDKKDATESPALPRDAGQKPDLEEPDDPFDLPKPKRQADYDAEDETDPDKRKADSAFDDLYIEVDESELESELDGQPPGRKA
jgi:hypothetical protein